MGTNGNRDILVPEARRMIAASPICVGVALIGSLALVA